MERFTPLLSPRTHLMDILVKTQIKNIPVDMGFVCWTPERSGVVGGWFLKYLLLDTLKRFGHKLKDNNTRRFMCLARYIVADAQ